MRILALDLGTTTGWCVDTIDNSIEYGSISFAVKNRKFNSPSLRFVYFREWLNEMYENKFDIVYYEMVMAHKGVHASHCFGGFLAILQEFCLCRGVPFEGVPVGTIKKYITGNGAAKKWEVIEAVEKLGYTPDDDNAADAVALFEYAYNIKFIKEKKVKKEDIPQYIY